MTLQFLSQECPAGVAPNDWAIELTERARVLRESPMAAPNVPLQVLGDLTMADQIGGVNG